MAEIATEAIRYGTDGHQIAGDRRELPLKLPSKLRAHATGEYWRRPPRHCPRVAVRMTTRDLLLTAGDADTQEIHNATMKIALFRQLSQIPALAS
jgi:hypothetical protein